MSTRSGWSLSEVAGRPPTARALFVLVVAAVMLVGCGVGLVHGRSEWWVMLGVGAIIGALGAGAVCWWIVWRPLGASARVANHVTCGNLSETFPDSGPADLKMMNRLLNTLLADFQEILLLFEHLNSSALGAMGRCVEDGSAGRSDQATVRSALLEMKSVIESFTFFGVEVREGVIRDTSIERSLGGEARSAPPELRDRVADSSQDR